MLEDRSGGTVKDAIAPLGDPAGTAFAEALFNGVSGRNDWVMGLALQQDDYRNTSLPAFDFAYSVPGLFVQDEYRASETLSLSASARLDHHNVYGTFVSPRLAVVLRPGGADSPWRSEER